MPKHFTYIVCSPHGRNGKSLFARLLADYLILNGETPELFDTDITEKKLSACFPSRTIVIDLDKVTNQMQLFDTLVAPATGPRIVDVTHRSFSKFFKLMQEMGFVQESRERDNEPVIFYLLDADPDSYTQAVSLREHFKETSVVFVENQHNGRPDRQFQAGDLFKAVTQHELHFFLPTLDQMFASVIDDPSLSLSEFTQEPPAALPPGKLSLAYMSREARLSIRGWLKEVNAEFQRLLEMVRLRAEMSFKRPL